MAIPNLGIVSVTIMISSVLVTSFLTQNSIMTIAYGNSILISHHDKGANKSSLKAHGNGDLQDGPCPPGFKYYESTGYARQPICEGDATYKCPEGSDYVVIDCFAYLKDGKCPEGYSVVDVGYGQLRCMAKAQYSCPQGYFLRLDNTCVKLINP